jgi:hypothetical protein
MTEVTRFVALPSSLPMIALQPANRLNASISWDETIKGLPVPDRTIGRRRIQNSGLTKIETVMLAQQHLAVPGPNSLVTVPDGISLDSLSR